MAPEASIAVSVLAGGGLVVASVSFVPPLNYGGPDAPAKSEVELIDPNANGYAYCQNNLPGVNCRCFTYVASQILQEDHERIPGWAYANQWELAKEQAKGNCS